MLYNYIVTYLIDVAALAFLFYLVHSNNILNQRRKRPFYLCAALTVLIIVSEAGTIIAGNGNVELRNLNIICNIFGFTMAPMIPIIFIAIFNVKILKTNKLLLLPSILNMFAVVLSPWLRIVFYIDAFNRYARGKYFYIFVSACIINLAILWISTVMTRQKHHYPIRAKFTVLSLFVVAGTSIQLMRPLVYSSWHIVTFSLLLYYIMLSEFDGSFDALTRLHNRLAYDKMAKKLDGRKPYSVIVIDINNFKEINDNYGHDFGDTALKVVATVIRKSFDVRCACYRAGGDEFYIICRESDQEKLVHQLKNMTNNLEKERENDGRLPTVAYGYSIFKGEKGIGFQEVLKEADDQMYFFKNLQKDREMRKQTP